ncbi:MAG: RNA polymerase sigma factor region1.1 domain-containing protein, partial [Acidiferrobacterales bacterium]
MERQTKGSELKRLILNGKEQGFLTYRELNELLPDETQGTEQVEEVVDMLSDMGIEVFDHAPEPDALLLNAEPPDDDVAEEAEAVLPALVDSEFGSKTDPLNAYLRQVRAVDLLSRSEEIALAKRIEDGTRQIIEAVAACPMAIAEALHMVERIALGKMRWTDLVGDVIYPQGDNIDAATTVRERLGPPVAAARLCFAQIRKLHDSLLRALKKHGIGSPQVRKIQRKLAKEFLKIKFVPKGIERICEPVRELVTQAHNREW